MGIANSRVTAQGQISVPSEIRRKLGIGPGSVLEWHEYAGEIVLRRAGRFTSEDVHKALFPRDPKARTLAELKAGVASNVRTRHARR